MEGNSTMVISATVPGQLGGVQSIQKISESPLDHSTDRQWDNGASCRGKKRYQRLVY